MLATLGLQLVLPKKVPSGSVTDSLRLSWPMEANFTVFGLEDTTSSARNEHNVLC